MIKIVSLSKNQWMLIVLVTLFGVVAMAASGGDGDHGVPWGLVIPQIVNFTIVVALLTYLLKGTVRDHFKERGVEFSNQVTRAESALREAEERKRQISERIKRLESNATEDMQKAKAEAENLRKRILVDAETLSKKMLEDAQRSGELELEKAKNSVRRELLDKSLKLAKNTLVEEVDAPAQKRLRHEFVEKIQVVQ